ncbi:MAG: transketolase C-terminal domain-containing protein, partial [Acidimicrobiales bacterium]
VGKMLAAATEAAETLEAEGLSVTVWDPRVVKPFDEALVEDALAHSVVVTIEDGLADGGVGSALADELRRRSDGGGPKIAVLGVPDRYIPHNKPDVILAQLGLDAAGIAGSARALL